MENFKIYSSTQLAAEGKKIARLEGNRDLNPKAVEAKKKSLLNYGLLVPAVVVDAQVAVKKNLKVIDFETNEPVAANDVDNYLVLLDANHRYKAHLDLKAKEDVEYNGEFYFMYSLNETVDIDKVLAEINIATTPWKGSDFVKGAAMMIDEKLPMLEFISGLTSKGYSLDCASKWATFSGKINKTVLVKAIGGSIAPILRKEGGIERGKHLHEAATHSFGADFLKSRTLIDWIIGIYDEERADNKEGTVQRLINFLDNINRETAESIEKSKGVRGGDTKESIINKKLRILWEKFNEEHKAAAQ